VILPLGGYAETYKWEDANGPHYTDNAASVPEKFRDKVFKDAQVETKNTTPPVGIGTSQPSSALIHVDLNATYKTNEEQRRLADAMKQQQAQALAQSNKKAEGALQKLAGFMAIWLLIGLVVFIAWVLTIVDIVRSDFTTPSNKTVWVILVVLIPFLGMLLYYIFGLSQKSNSVGYKDKQREELLARLKPRDPNGKDFII